MEEKNPIDVERAIPEEKTSQEERDLDRRTITLLAGYYQSIQRLRVGMQMSLTTRSIEEQRAKNIAELLEKLECETVKWMKEECEGESIYPWLSSVKGIGPRLAGMLIGLIDIERCPTVSSLWRYAGFAVVNGKAERRTKGEKLHFNMLLKKSCFLVARSMVMANAEPYVGIYRKAKERYINERPEWTGKGSDLHKDLAARRVMVKIFLQHLWAKWRELEGLPVSKPYVHDILGHGKMIEPE